jgi:hypothetical protein
MVNALAQGNGSRHIVGTRRQGGTDPGSQKGGIVFPKSDGTTRSIPFREEARVSDVLNPRVDAAHRQPIRRHPEQVQPDGRLQAKQRQNASKNGREDCLSGWSRHVTPFRASR